MKVVPLGYNFGHWYICMHFVILKGKVSNYQIEFYEREVPDSDFPDYIGYVDNRYIIIPWYYDRHEFGNFDALRCSVDDDDEYTESYYFNNYVVPYILNGKKQWIETYGCNTW